MPKFVPPMPLVIFRQLKLPGFYPLGGTKGLYLRIRGASEIYILRYQDTSGNRRCMSLGLRSSMLLSEARSKATAIHARLSKGINPTPKSTTRRQAKVLQSSKKAASASKSFADVMDLWLKYRVETNYWVNDRKEPYATSNLLARHVLPHLGKVSINTITVEDIRDVLVPIWTTKTITAKKALRNIRAILNWARAMNYRESSEDLCSLQGPLGVLMEGARKNAVRKENFAALPYDKIPAFIQALWHIDGRSRWMLMFAILTASRMKAVRFATWGEIDFENRLWEIPPEHDKIKDLKRDRTIYLSRQAIEVLQKVRPDRPKADDLIFKTAKGGSFSDAATNALIRRMHASKKALDGTGWIDPDKSKREGKVCVITAHGTARSGFRTWAKDDRFGNNRKYDQEAAELCLLHSKASDDYHGAYDRARLSTERQRLMDDWGGSFAARSYLALFPLPEISSQKLDVHHRVCKSSSKLFKEIEHMPQVQLGKIDRIPVRDVWRHEALDFTKWLAQEENLTQLGDACSIDLELVDMESAVGSFAVDIFAKESGSDRRVVIENQLEYTNHDHLGKIITYATGKNAEVVIWVVARARDEHRKAIEWLNEHTDDECSFSLKSKYGASETRDSTWLNLLTSGHA